VKKQRRGKLFGKKRYGRTANNLSPLLNLTYCLPPCKYLKINSNKKNIP
jgi:hypothetical protein